MIIIDDDGVMHKVLPMDTLDKIRAEFISEIPKNYMGIEPNGENCVFSLNYILQIIDKYRNEVSK